MKTLNKVFLVGAVGKDPETRFTSGGLAISSFSIATESPKRKDAPEDAKNTQWHQCVSFCKLAEIVQQYVVKGTKLHVEGTIDYQQYEKDGVTKYVTKIIVNDLILLPTSERIASNPSVEVQHNFTLEDGIPF